jgi:cytochrome c2
VAAEERAETGGALGTVEPGGGNVLGAVIGGVVGAVAGAVAPHVYAKAKNEAGKAWQKFKTAHEHLTSPQKLGGPDKDPRGGWKQTVQRIADSMDEHADRITSRQSANAIRFAADLLRSWIPE